MTSVMIRVLRVVLLEGFEIVVDLLLLNGKLVFDRPVVKNVFGCNY